jgi:hypothetical protein
MTPHTSRLLLLSMLSASLLITAGCAAQLGIIRRVDQPTEIELRANWKDYRTYCLDRYAMLFQMKNDKTIQKGSGWREVASDQMAENCAVWNRPSPVMQVLGEENENYGYLIYSSYDGVSVSIIDSKTILLNYHRAPRGGP